MSKDKEIQNNKHCKLFAFYLPQYHEIAENDRWWGKGYTEWVAVKNAKKLFANHQQPKVPLNNNYYNLMDKDTVVWQTKLMNDYKVDGLIYYHYYFKGKLLLEKPAENLLKWKDINQPFFFCWANHSWYKAKNDNRELLIKQEYGAEKEWKQHFEYLVKFFKDDRYEKYNNKPLLMIYDAGFPEINNYIDYLDHRCKCKGFSGIQIIEGHCNTAGQYPADSRSKVFLKIPAYPLTNNFIYYLKETIRRTRFVPNFLITINGEKLYKKMLKNHHINTNTINGIFFEWDNTPRHGKRGYIINPPAKETFMQYMNKHKNNEYMFINAWNEWAEGMMLEPTEENDYKYLEWIKEWVENSEE